MEVKNMEINAAAPYLLSWFNGSENGPLLHPLTLLTPPSLLLSLSLSRICLSLSYILLQVVW